MRGSSVPPDISTGTSPAYFDRSSVTGCIVAGQVGDDEDRIFGLEPAEEREDVAVVRPQELDRAAAERPMLLAQRDHPAHPVQQRERRSLLRLDVHRLVAVDRIHDQRRVEPRRIGA